MPEMYPYDFESVHVDMMKALLKLGATSKHNHMASENQIAVEMDTYPQKIQRKIGFLVEKGYVFRNQERGKQRSKLHMLRTKGFFYLLLHGKLNDSEIEEMIYTYSDDLLNVRSLTQLKRKLQGVPGLGWSIPFRNMVSIVKDCILETREKVSFEFFNEENAGKELISAFHMGVMKSALNLTKGLSRKPNPQIIKKQYPFLLPILYLYKKLLKTEKTDKTKMLRQVNRAIGFLAKHR